VSTSFTLHAPFRGERLVFRPLADGSAVMVDHHYPQGMPGNCYRPGVCRRDQRMSVRDARQRYASALRAGWVR
jgi:hypothetical protein